jgi:hypothetical protein
MTMNHTTSSFRTKAALAVVATVSMLAACSSSSTPRLDANFGNAIRQAKAVQTINPAGSANRDQVLGMDGKDAVSGVIRYQESFSAPVNTFDVGISGKK